MPSEPGGRILIVDDERSMCELLEQDLRRRGFEPVWRLRAEEAFALAQEQEFDVLLTDLNLPGMNGLELCERLSAHRPDIPVIVITAFGSLETAVAALRAGAYDFVTKPLDLDLIAFALERAVRHRQLQEQVRSLRETVRRSQPLEELIGESRPMRELAEQLSRVADLETTVLISGESGTGKELVAKALHRLSRRREGPFIAVNCAALPETLLESELFGHHKGAFTDAREPRRGLFQQASGGTLLLDEIGDLPLALQPKLLRVLEERKVRPLGANAEVSVDVRLLAATHRNLETAVAEGRFREDLFYRLNVIPLDLPPLRLRGTDVLLLARHFLQQFASRFGKAVTGVTDAAAERLLAYDWPGNVRELRNALERAVALTRLEKIAVEDLPEKIRSYRRPAFRAEAVDDSDLLPLEEVESRHIRRVLDAVGENRTLAARILGLDRKTLYRKLQKDPSP